MSEYTGFIYGRTIDYKLTKTEIHFPSFFLIINLFFFLFYFTDNGSVVLQVTTL